MNSKRTPFPSESEDSRYRHAVARGRQRERKDGPEHITRNFYTICRNHTWIGDGIFYEKRNEPEAAEAASGICVRSDDRSVCMVLLIPAIEMAEDAGGIAWIPAAAGFLLGWDFCSFLIQ